MHVRLAQQAQRKGRHGVMRPTGKQRVEHRHILLAFSAAAAIPNFFYSAAPLGTTSATSVTSGSSAITQAVLEQRAQAR